MHSGSRGEEMLSMLSPSLIRFEVEIALLVGLMLDITPTEERWPGFLDGMLLWCHEGTLHVRSCANERSFPRWMKDTRTLWHWVVGRNTA